jgi:uncharacterized protein YneF (UPF0154 family)
MKRLYIIIVLFVVIFFTGIFFTIKSINNYFSSEENVETVYVTPKNLDLSVKL